MESNGHTDLMSLEGRGSGREELYRAGSSHTGLMTVGGVKGGQDGGNCW